MPQIKSESPWSLSHHLTNAYTYAAQVAAVTSGGGGGGYGSPSNDPASHHLSSSSPSGVIHQQHQQQHSSALQDLQNTLSATTTGSPIQHQQ